jgi:hypothetical protein
VCSGIPNPEVRDTGIENAKQGREGKGREGKESPLKKILWKLCLLCESPLKSPEFGVPELQYISTKRIRTSDEYSNAFVTVIEKRGADCRGEGLTDHPFQVGVEKYWLLFI